MRTEELIRKAGVILEDVEVRNVAKVRASLPPAFSRGVMKALEDAKLGLIEDGHGMDAATVEKLRRRTNEGIRAQLGQELFGRQDGGRFWRDHAPSVGSDKSEQALLHAAAVIAEEYQQAVDEGSMAVGSLGWMITIARRHDFVRAGGAKPLCAPELTKAICDAYDRGYISPEMYATLLRHTLEFDLVKRAYVEWKKDRSVKKKELATLTRVQRILHYVGGQTCKEDTQLLQKMVKHVHSSKTIVNSHAKLRRFSAF